MRGIRTYSYHYILVSEEATMTPDKRKVILRVVLDVISVACVALPVLILYYYAKPYHRGFYCNDETLMHPYLSNTVPTWVAGFVGIILPCIAILTIEGIKAHKAELKMVTYIGIVYQLVIPFFFGAGLTQLTTDIGKYTIGRLRPHFLTVCVPDPAKCAASTGYITEDICTGKDTAAIEEARLSFPSGHSSMSFYCMIWLMVFLQYKFTWKRYWLVRPVLQAIAFYLAYYTALSRISDYMHHWSDVLSGAVIGIVVALLDVFFMSNILPWRRNKCQDCSSDLPLYTTPNKGSTTVSQVIAASS
ncbi:putative phosphatidate phosphatase isoform X2 [Dreissena polymorpha]|uniref:putative phosphatidate phosphatase isoform X2 n=1 Tax=Dreissena polymorpha TaxID=45954 RepID=UPI0022647E42|nr:putative phosphatidate phosphatase isoform X2 [Dreissena polymorpha]